MDYIEQDCTFTHEGRSFTAGGAVVTADRVIAYCNDDMTTLTTWHGEHLGDIIASMWWFAPGWTGTRMYQITARINGKLWTGRTQGSSMVACLKPKRTRSTP